MNPGLLLTALLGGLLSLSAPAFAEAPPLLEKGKSAYKRFCAHCHGIDMVNPGTSSYDLRKWPKDRKEDFYRTVKKGKGNMPAWGDILLPEELDALWVYVITRGGKEPLPADAAARDAAPETPPPQLVAENRLTACLARNGGAMSGWRASGGTGLDFRLSEALAAELGLALEVFWFESEPEEESDPVREAYALLALGLCDLVPGHPLYESAVGAPPSPRAAPPRWRDRPESWRHRQVDLEPVAVSRPYLRAEIGIILAPSVADRQIRSLADLEGLRTGIQQGTLAGALLQTQAPAAVKAAAVTLPPGPSFLWRMEAGAFDAALIDVAAYDFHKRQNAVSKLHLTDYRHPLGFNIGYALLARHTALLSRVNAALERLMAEAAVARMAAAERLHYAAPRTPYVAARLTLEDLLIRR